MTPDPESDREPDESVDDGRSAASDADGGSDRSDVDGRSVASDADDQSVVSERDSRSTDSVDDQPVEAGDATFTLSTLHDVLEHRGRPVVTAAEVATALDISHEQASDHLSALADTGDVRRLAVSTDPVVWYPRELENLTERERVICFPNRREIVVDQPSQFTRAQLTQFAHLEDTTRTGAYRYVVRKADVWHAPHDTFDGLLRTVRQVLPQRVESFETWLRETWERSNLFRLTTHPDGYTVLEAESASVMGNVARQKLDEEHLHASLSDTESWVREGAEATIKRVLYEAGYPVRDERELDRGESLEFDLLVTLREYQRGWVDRFLEQGAGVLVGPPGSGKTIAAIGAMERVGGETLVLVPSRELAAQWREALLAHTTLEPEQVGEYHGGAKERRPVTVATYQTAGMDRHRSLFDRREWGLIVYDEVHHVPARIYRRSTDLQSTHRLGLSATPIREDDRERDIFTLIGPPIGTDWQALFEAGFVQEPEVELRYVPWASEEGQNAYASADGRERHRIAATNPAKVEEVCHLLAANPAANAIVFVDWLDQGEEIAAALDVPFVSGETPHGRRYATFEAFRDGELDVLVVSRVGDEGIDLPAADLAIVASGLGGSRRQGAQRAGRTMRPAGGSRVIVLATRGTSEEDFAQRQQRHLREKGIRVRETEAVTGAHADRDG